MPSFTDLFSSHSAVYARYRPTYPKALFEFLYALTPAHHTAWDCGTGNGQCALGLADYFENITATDPSAAQLKQAPLHPKIIYKTEKAETPSFANSSVDLITVAQAIHWFDLDVFYREAKRVMKPTGAIAAWTYSLPAISAAVDSIVQHFHNVIVDPFWQEENRMAEREYADLPFPFQQIPPPDFFTEKNISLDDLCGLLQSWSATQKFIQHHGYDPVTELRPQWEAAWGKDNPLRRASWKIIVKAGKQLL